MDKKTLEKLEDAIENVEKAGAGEIKIIVQNGKIEALEVTISQTIDWSNS